MAVPVPVSTVITRVRFRELIDPMLDALGFVAEDVVTLSFDSDGFEVTVFERAEGGGRVLLHDFGRDSKFAKQTIRVHIGQVAE